MKLLSEFIAVLATILALSTAQAQSVGPRHATAQLGTLVSAASMNASSSFTVPTNVPLGYGLMVLYITVLDANNTVTALNLSCTASHDGNTTDYTLQDCTVVAGVCTSNNASWTKNPSAITSPKIWPWRVDIESFKDLECTITNTGGEAADKLTIVGYVATKG